MELSIADPNQHKELFQAANKVDTMGSADGDVIIDRLSVVSGANSSVANLSIADGSMINPSIMNFSIANASVANMIPEVKNDDEESDELPQIDEEEDSKFEGDACTKEQRAEYLALQNRSLMEICEALEAKLAKHDNDQAKINKQFTFLTDQLTVQKETADKQAKELEDLKKSLEKSQNEATKAKRQADKEIMAAKFKADAVVQNYKMKESRDIIRAKAEIAIA